MSPPTVTPTRAGDDEPSPPPPPARRPSRPRTDAHPRGPESAGRPSARPSVDRPSRPVPPPRPQARSRRPARRRAWAHRIVVAATVLTALAVLAAAIPFAYLRWRVGQVDRVELGTALAKPAAPELPVNILLVGSDTRAQITGAETKSFGDAEQVQGQRSDTMMVVHADPSAGVVSVLSVPRDLYVTIVGSERQDRINKAFDTDAGGGPERLVKTIQRELGIQINHYAEVDFVGFRGVVKAVGGVPVWVPHPARDRVTGLNLPEAGCITLTPDQALAFVRSRHYQEYRDGRWRTDPTADLGRIERQQGFMRHTLRRAIERGARNPVVLNRLIDSAVKSVTLDDDFSTRELARLARKFRSLAPESVHTFVLPTEPVTIDGAAVLLLEKAKAQDTINQFNGFLPPPPITAAQIVLRLRDAGGATTDAAMARAAARFTELGFTGVDVAAAAAEDASVRTVVRHRPDTLDKARFVAAYLIGGSELVEDASLEGVDVEVDLGENYTGLRAQSAGAAGPAFTENDEAAEHACT